MKISKRFQDLTFWGLPFWEKSKDSSGSVKEDLKKFKRRFGSDVLAQMMWAELAYPLGGYFNCCGQDGYRILRKVEYSRYRGFLSFDMFCAGPPEETNDWNCHSFGGCGWPETGECYEVIHKYALRKRIHFLRAVFELNTWYPEWRRLYES